MFSNWKQLTVLPLMAAMLWVAGCSDQDGPLSPAQQPLAPAEAALHTGQSAGGAVAGNIPEFNVSETIGPEGGSLGIPGYTLTVPRNAVREATVFTFASVNNGYVQIKATATAVGSSDLNDVGRAGFSIPVQVSLSYESAAGGLPQWLKLVIAYVRPDGQLESVPSKINPVKRVVTGAVSHFSEYVLAMP
jgi:hypothetical protein